MKDLPSQDEFIKYSRIAKTAPKLGDKVSILNNNGIDELEKYQFARSVQSEVRRRINICFQIRQMRENIKAHVNVIRREGEASIQDQLMADIYFTSKELLDSDI